MNWGLTMSEQDMLSEKQLAQLFKEAAEDAPRPDPALMRRIVADAQAVSGAQADMRANPTVGTRLSAWLSMLGGWRGVGGLITAACVGLWFGFASPDVVLGQGMGVRSDTTVQVAPGDFLPAVDSILEEG